SQGNGKSCEGLFALLSDWRRRVNLLWRGLSRASSLLPFGSSLRLCVKKSDVHAAAGGSAEDLAEAVEVHDRREGFLLHDGGGEGGFFALQGADLFLDGVLGDQAIGDHGIGLSNTVGAVDGLGLHRRVPPGVVEHHIAGGGEVEAGTGGLEREQEDGRAFGGLKLIDQRLPVLGL